MRIVEYPFDILVVFVLKAIIVCSRLLILLEEVECLYTFLAFSRASRPAWHTYVANGSRAQSQYKTGASVFPETESDESILPRRTQSNLQPRYQPASEISL